MVSQGDTSDGELVNATHAFLKNRKLHYCQFSFDWYGGMASRERARAVPIQTNIPLLNFRNSKLYLRNSYYRTKTITARIFDREKPSMLLIEEIQAIWHKIDTDDNWSLGHQKIESIHEMRNVFGR